MKEIYVYVAIALIFGFMVGFGVAPREVKQVTETVVDRVSYDKLNQLEQERDEARLRVIEYAQQLEGYKKTCRFDTVR